MRNDSGEKPNSDELSTPRARSLRTSHQPTGRSTELAPRIRAIARSKGPSVAPRVGSDATRDTNMNDVHMITVITAAAMPIARGENCLNKRMP